MFLNHTFKWAPWKRSLIIRKKPFRIQKDIYTSLNNFAKYFKWMVDYFPIFFWLLKYMVPPPKKMVWKAIANHCWVELPWLFYRAFDMPQVNFKHNVFSWQNYSSFSFVFIVCLSFSFFLFLRVKTCCASLMCFFLAFLLFLTDVPLLLPATPLLQPSTPPLILLEL